MRDKAAKHRLVRLSTEAERLVLVEDSYNADKTLDRALLLYGGPQVQERMIELHSAHPGRLETLCWYLPDNKMYALVTSVPSQLFSRFTLSIIQNQTNDPAVLAIVEKLLPKTS